MRDLPDIDRVAGERMIKAKKTIATEKLETIAIMKQSEMIASVSIGTVHFMN